MKKEKNGNTRGMKRTENKPYKSLIIIIIKIITQTSYFHHKRHNFCQQMDEHSFTSSFSSFILLPHFLHSFICLVFFYLFRPQFSVYCLVVTIINIIIGKWDRRFTDHNKWNDYDYRNVVDETRE